MIDRVGLGIAFLAFEFSGDRREVQVFPAGRFRATDGRPHDAPGWYIDAAIAARVIEQIEARANEMVIDYEHQTLNAPTNGQPAPAAGWTKKFEWREGEGLYAVDASWTDKAKAHIAAREYRYLSPVFEYDKKTGAVRRLLMLAITNYPALDGMETLNTRAAARVSVERRALSAEESTVCRLMGLDQSEYINSRSVREQSERLNGTEKGCLTADEFAVCRAMGLSPDEFKKTREAVKGG